MPSDAHSDIDAFYPAGPFSGRCYCGDSRLTAQHAPRIVSYCHCRDCRRWTGAPLAAFAAFSDNDVSGLDGPGLTVNPGVTRWSCARCGSPLAARFDYLPGQTYVPLGILDDAELFAPQVHSHAEKRLRWLHLADDLPRIDGSGRDLLAMAGGETGEEMGGETQ